MAEQHQGVTVTRLADRHADLHGRDFAESVQIVVPAGDLRSVLRAAAELVDQPLGRYSITVSEPYDTAETTGGES